jgi:TolB protein
MNAAGRIAATVGILIIAGLATPAHAAFPGDNGKIAFHSNRDGNLEIYVMDSNGANQTRLTNNSTLDASPAWSADGTKIAFTSARDGNNEIYKMNADGTGQTRLTTNAVDDVTPSWSPDGTKIYFATNRDGNFEVYQMNQDGTSPTRITNHAALDSQPVMSPNGDKIAFLTNRDGNFEIYLMNPNGSSPQNITQSSQSESEPNWGSRGDRFVLEQTASGDAGNVVGTTSGFGCCFMIGLVGAIETGPAYPPLGDFTTGRVAFATTVNDANPLSCGPCNYEIYTMNISNGQGLTRLTFNSAVDQSPDWQPVVKQYARPQGATPRRIALVPAFQNCSGLPAQNATPKSNPTKPSCVPAKSESTYLTLGSPEANGAPANGVGFVKIKVVCNGGAPNEFPPCLTTPGDQLDGRVTMSQTDVRCQGTSGSCPNGALSDYVGNLMLELSVRATDRTSGGFGAGTIEDFQVRLPVPCVTTGTGNIGSTCSVTSSLDAAMGSTTAITEGKRTIWEVQSTRVYDGGADGVATTLGDNKVFLSDGLFFP